MRPRKHGHASRQRTSIWPDSQFLPLLKFIQKIPCSKFHLPSGLQIFRYCEFFSAMKGSEVCKDRKSARFFQLNSLFQQQWFSKVLANEKRGGLKLVSFEWSLCKLFTLIITVQTNQFRPHPVRGIKLLRERETLFPLFANNNCFTISA